MLNTKSGKRWLMNDRIKESKKVIYTVGHSNIQVSEFIGLIKAFMIEVVVDVRSRPYSKYAAQFNKNEIHKFLSANNIIYLYLGNLVGGKPQEREFYDNEGYVKYDRLAVSPSFQTGISRLMKGIDLYWIVLMCSEEDPTNCHRRLLIGRVLNEQGIEVLHIRKEGIVHTEKDMAGIQFQPDLFGKQDAPLWRSSKPVLYKNKDVS